MSPSQIGLLALFAFALFQGVRDALFGNIFQSVSFLFVAVLAFASSTAVFLGYAAWRTPGDFACLRRHLPTVLTVNAATAAAWLAFLYALRHLEPAVVATLYNGAGPLTAIIAGRLGWTTAIAKPAKAELLAYAGLTTALAGLAIVVLSNRSGLAQGDWPVQATALAAAALGGAAITVSYFHTRRLNDAGLSTEGGLGSSFVVALLAAAVLEAVQGTPERRPDIGDIAWLTALAFILIVLPALLVRIGVKRSSALAANVFRTLGPVCVFAVQQADRRLQFSGATLACIVAFCACSIAASVLRFWSERKTR